MTANRMLLTGLLLAVALGGVLDVYTNRREANAASRKRPPLRLGYVKLNRQHIAQWGPGRDRHALLAFVPTESRDRRVLVSVTECFGTGSPRITYVGAAYRQQQGVDGVQVIGVFCDPLPLDILLHLTVAQPGARTFGPVVKAKPEM